MLLEVLNAVFIIAVVVVVLAFALYNGCGGYTPIPTPGELEDVDVLETCRFVNGLNIISNLVFVIAGIIVLALGFPLEGIIFLATAVFSILWHASGEKVWSVLDFIFASLSFIVLTLMYFRIVQVRGWPLMSPLYLALPLLGVLAFSAVHAKDQNATNYLNDRISHLGWHLLAGAAFVIVALEYVRVPCLLPNGRLRVALMRREVRMWQSMRSSHRSCGNPSFSACVGLFEDLARGGGTREKNKKNLSA